MKFFFVTLLSYSICLFSYSSRELFSLFPNNFFLETGTFLGDGIQNALDSNSFRYFLSIELSDHYYEISTKRFHNNTYVDIRKGDSSVVLFSVIKNINVPITFWLDGHFSGGGTAKGTYSCPILQELDQIKEHHIKNHTILIDDARLFGTVAFDYISKEMIEEKIKEINPLYVIEYMDCEIPQDVLVAYVPNI